MPSVSPVELMARLTDPELVPVPEAITSQAGLPLIAQSSVPPPVLLIERLWALIVAPRVPLNVIAEGVTVRAGGGGATSNVTLIVLGDACAPGAVIVMTAVCVPAVSEERFAVAETLAGPVPEPGLKVSHARSLVACQFRVPAPVEFEIAKVWDAGFGPP